MFYFEDHLGSIRGAIDASGKLIGVGEYTPFGVPVKRIPRVRFGFTGEEQDDSGKVYLRARYYDPYIGRFLSKDPVLHQFMDEGKQNRYNYVGNAPVNFIDKPGLFRQYTSYFFESAFSGLRDLLNTTTASEWYSMKSEQAIQSGNVLGALLFEELNFQIGGDSSVINDWLKERSQQAIESGNGLKATGYDLLRFGWGGDFSDLKQWYSEQSEKAILSGKGWKATGLDLLGGRLPGTYFNDGQSLADIAWNLSTIRFPKFKWLQKYGVRSKSTFSKISKLSEAFKIGLNGGQAVVKLLEKRLQRSWPEDFFSFIKIGKISY